MTKRMLIDATHAEETRVVVLDGSRLEDFDVETSTKRQLKGNIYLAKVVRVEPSLQAAFVEYGGNRHGFLAFGEIHPDYYQIPIADRQRLIEQEAEEARREEEEEDRAAEAADSGAPVQRAPVQRDVVEIDGVAEEPDEATPAEAASDEAASAGAGPHEIAPGPAVHAEAEPVAAAQDDAAQNEAAPAETAAGVAEPDAIAAPGAAGMDNADDETPDAPQSSTAQPAKIVTEVVSASVEVLEAEPQPGEPASHAESPMFAAVVEIVEAEGSWATADTFAREAGTIEADTLDAGDGPGAATASDSDLDDEALSPSDPIPEEPPPETVGGEGDGAEETRERRVPSRFLRNYKIQEVIKRRQILLVQVVKEERGTKGAALTTYLSLAGRFSVLMPNSPRGGGISRKITSATDRRRLKEIMAELEIPRGMGLIVRTAGANRPKPEIKRDCEYLLRLWDDIRDHTLKSVAPALIYEEASLIKRAIRDVYSRDIDEIQVDGEQGWRAAHEFMRMLMPSHAKKVQLWKNGGQPLFSKYAVEAQLDSMLQPTVQLRSGGYLVINQTEALVAIDVNSGRSTRERGIEETALRTNLEAADEVARQLRLRDLAGLIVIDFIDMETRKHNGMVEKRLKEALKNDRARIQVGHISHFGLMEMSRQRLRPSLAETSFILCAHCGGTGHVRSTESAAIHVLRGIEEEGAKRRASEIVVHCAPAVALYILNHKRERLADIELRYAMRVLCLGDDMQMTSQFRIERVRAQVEAPVAITQDVVAPPPELEVEDEAPDVEDEEEEAETEGEAAARPVPGETAEEAEHRRRRRRRRRRGGGRREDAPALAAAPAGDDVPAFETEPAEPVAAAPVAAEPVTAEPSEVHIEGVPEQVAVSEDEQRGRRRGRRGGRRRRQESNGEMPAHAEPGADQPELPPVYSGPTPANPFGGHTFDIFDVMDQAEQSAPPASSQVMARPEPAAASPEPVPTTILAEPVEPAPPEPVEPVAATSAPAESMHAEPVPAEPAAIAESVPEERASDEAVAAAPATPDPVGADPVPEAPVAAVSVPEEPVLERPVAAETAVAEAVPAEARAAESAAVTEPAATAPVPAASIAAEPQQEREPDTVAAAAPEPEPVVPANDVAPEPAIKPILIGADLDVAGEKKRGWWRR